jgi:Mrp family chromosome partitioning ATPase
VITAGPAPPNPADLLIGDGLGRLVKDLQDRFDHVVVDCPPVAGLADTALIAATVQSVLYVVQARSTPASMVRVALGQLDGDRVAGGVLTLFDGKRVRLDQDRGRARPNAGRSPHPVTASVR